MITISIGPGEAVDRLTILKIKRDHSGTAGHATNLIKQIINLEKDLRELYDRMSPSAQCDFNLVAEKLLEVNQELWDLETELRKHQSLFFQGMTSRKIAYKNSERSSLKIRLDGLLNANDDVGLISLKQY